MATVKTNVASGFSRTSPIEAARSAERELAQLARPAGSFDARRYFRTDPNVDLGFYNVGTDRVRAMAKAMVRARPAWGIDDALAFADRLITDRYLEVKAVGIEVLACYRTMCTARLLPTWKRWLARGHSANWATTDGLCGSLIGPLLVAFPRRVPQVAGWSRHRSVWVRRASAVALIPRLERYLRANGPRIPRTTVRYAIERFPPAKRRVLLSLTRSSSI